MEPDEDAGGAAVELDLEVAAVELVEGEGEGDGEEEMRRAALGRDRRCLGVELAARRRRGGRTAARGRAPSRARVRGRVSIAARGAGGEGWLERGSVDLGRGVRGGCACAGLRVWGLLCHRDGEEGGRERGRRKEGGRDAAVLAAVRGGGLVELMCWSFFFVGLWGRRCAVGVCWGPRGWQVRGV